MKLKTYATVISILLTPSIVGLNLAQAQDNAQLNADNAGWTVPDGSQNWGGSGQSNDNAVRSARRNSDRTEKALDKAIPTTPVDNPFDASGIYMGETQVLSNTGIDPASGASVPDAPVITEQ